MREEKIKLWDRKRKTQKQKPQNSRYNNVQNKSDTADTEKGLVYGFQQ